MKATLAYRPTPVTCAPVTCGRELGDCPVANRPLRCFQAELLAALGDLEQPVYLRSDAWLGAGALRELVGDGGPAVCHDADGVALAWVGGSPEGPVASPPRRMTGPDAFLIRYPWDLLRLNERLIGSLTASDVRGSVASGVVIEGQVVLGEGSRLLPGVFIEGNVVIGRNCKIGPNCYLRGCTAIGDDCHIGQAVEVKNSILMCKAAIGHLSYCGDSIVGERTNFGAGTITANFRHDGLHHRSMVGGELVDTGRRKLGAVLGDDVHTGIHTSIYPGRKLWPGVSTRPGEVVQKDRLA